MRPKIVFITNILRQPRCIRRINDFIARDYNVKVYGFDRAGDNRALPSFEYECIGINSNEDSYPKRLLKMKESISKVILREGKDSVFYIFSLDNAIAARLAYRNLIYIYEISDLMELQINNRILSNLLVNINRRIVKHALLTVYTSEGFVDFLLPHGYNKEKTIVIPNKLNKFCRGKSVEHKRVTNFDNIRFGFTGALRTETIFNFIKAVGEYGKHEVHLYGIYCDENNGRYSIKSLVDQYDNVFFHGPFNNPVDFPVIYSNIDIVLCYYNSSRNDLYLEPNKLYEALYYDCPIIVADDTFVGRKVKKLNVGYTIKKGDESSLIDFITSINKTNYDEKVSAIKSVNKEDCIDNPELLFQKLSDIL